ncbi:MAG: hypothetical protein ACWGOX_12920 [Desulforhopalus sp.]
MKYALIAMAVIYLITFGCSPEEDKQAGSHDKVTHTAVEPAATENKAPAAVHEDEHGEKTAAKQQEAAEHQPAKEQHAAIAQSAENKAETLMDKESQPVDSESADTEKTVEQAEVLVVEVQPEPEQKGAGEEMITMPCGQVMAKKDIPAGAPCLGYKQPVAVPGDDDLSAAMQKMVEATNNMVQVTRQMVIATQEMLEATKQATEGKAQEGHQQ